MSLKFWGCRSNNLGRWWVKSFWFEMISKLLFHAYSSNLTVRSVNIWLNLKTLFSLISQFYLTFPELFNSQTLNSNILSTLFPAQSRSQQPVLTLYNLNIDSHIQNNVLLVLASVGKLILLKKYLEIWFEKEESVVKTQMTFFSF